MCQWEVGAGKKSMKLMCEACSVSDEAFVMLILINGTSS